MDLLLASPFVTKITFYPLVTSQMDSYSSLLSRSSLNAKPVNNRLEELQQTFRTIVVETISTNANAIHDKNISYTTMLLKIAGITGEEADRLTSKLITGYSLVNRVLLTLMGIKQSDLTKISSSIIPCPLLRKPVSIISPRETASEIDIKYIIEESRREITKLVAIFADLFTSHDLFRANILATRACSGTKSGTINLNRLFSRENELVSHIVGGLQNGIISNVTLNDIIRDLSNERFTLGNYQALPVSLNPTKNIQVTNDTMMCTFQQPITTNLINNIDSLRELGIYISHIADSFDNSDALTINLGGMIAAYNNAIRGTNLNKIFIPHIGGPHTLSRQATVTFPGDSNPEGILNIPITESDEIQISIPMYNGNLDPLSDAQLLDILVYIDSLRNSDGTGDTRFANLQNEITHELARRRRSSRSN